MPEAAGFLGPPIKLDVSVPAAAWVELASSVAGVVAGADPGATVIAYGHVADGDVQVRPSSRRPRPTAGTRTRC